MFPGPETLQGICDPLCEIQKSQNLIMDNEHQSLISSINFTIILNFGMTLLSQ